MSNWFKKIFKVHEHDRKLFCTGKYALVYCKSCGAESIPWEVSKKHAEEWLKLNPNAMKEYLEIKNNRDEREDL